MKLYTLILSKIVSKYELETCYTLDEALKLYALWQMQQDVQACKNEEARRNADM
jgi:hypothetical protein